MIPASRQYRSRRAASSVGSLVDTVRICSASHPFCPLHRRRSSPDVAAAIVAAVHAGADHLTSSTVDLPPHKFLVTFATLHCRLYRLSVAFATVFPVFPRFPHDPPLAAVCGGGEGKPRCRRGSPLPLCCCGASWGPLRAPSPLRSVFRERSLPLVAASACDLVGAREHGGALDLGPTLSATRSRDGHKASRRLCARLRPLVAAGVRAAPQRGPQSSAYLSQGEPGGIRSIP